MNEQDEVVRLTSLLSAAVKFSNITQREVERQLDLSSGSLSRLFSGGIELKVKHVLDVCQAIGFPASVFFQTAYPQVENQLSPDLLQVQRLLLQLHPLAGADSAYEHPASTPNPTTQADIERLVIAAMGKFFSGLAAAPTNGTPR